MLKETKAGWVFGLLLLVSSAWAWAEEPATPAAPAGPASPVASPAVAGADPAAAIPDLPENRAEIEAVRAGELRLEPAPNAAAAPQAAAPRSPEMLEIDQALVAERALVAELEARLEGAPDETAALDLLREIERTKQRTEIEILRLQAKHARLAGREEQAAEIEAAVQQILAPALVPAPAAAAAARAASGSAASPAGDARR